MKPILFWIDESRSLSTETSQTSENDYSWTFHGYLQGMSNAFSVSIVRIILCYTSPTTSFSFCVLVHHSMNRALPPKIASLGQKCVLNLGIPTASNSIFSLNFINLHLHMYICLLFHKLCLSSLLGSQKRHVTRYKNFLVVSTLSLFSNNDYIHVFHKVEFD